MFLVYTAIFGSLLLRQLRLKGSDLLLHLWKLRQFLLLQQSHKWKITPTRHLEHCSSPSGFAGETLLTLRGATKGKRKQSKQRGVRASGPETQTAQAAMRASGAVAPAACQTPCVLAGRRLAPWLSGGLGSGTSQAGHSAAPADISRASEIAGVAGSLPACSAWS